MKEINFGLFLLLFVVSCSDSSGPDESDNGYILENRTEAQDFSLESISHGTQTLSQYKGKVVYLFFFGYNCPFCYNSGPRVQTQISNKHSKDDLQILGLDVWNGNYSEVVNFRNKTGAQFPLLQKASSVGTAYRAKNDYSVIVDKEGKIAFHDSEVNVSAINNSINVLIDE